MIGKDTLHMMLYPVQTAITAKEQNSRGMIRAATAAQRAAQDPTVRVKAARQTARLMSIRGLPPLR